MADEPDYAELERWAKEAERGDAGPWSEYVESLSRVGVVRREEGILNIYYAVNHQPEPEPPPPYEPCGAINEGYLKASPCKLPLLPEHGVHCDGSSSWLDPEDRRWQRMEEL